MCKNIPEDIYHIMLHCEFANKLWEEIEPLLKKIHTGSVTEEEKAFGIVQKKQTNGILLRNWLTYLLREFIAREERAAYHSAKKPNLLNFKTKFNSILEFEINAKLLRYKNENNMAFFEKIITHEQALCKISQGGEYDIIKVFFIA